MKAETYLNKDYFDMQRSKHRAIETLNAGENCILLKTEDGMMLRICSDDNNKLLHCNEQYEWLEAIHGKSMLGQYILLPESRLTGLKFNEVGYVCSQLLDGNLNYYIHPDKKEKLFKWYFDKTGGISYRLKIGYEMARSIEKIHELGYCLGNINSENVLINFFEPGTKQPPYLRFLCADSVSSYTHHPIPKFADLYCDPLVSINRSRNSICSDTYSYAVLLFELLTTCHPFIGEVCDDLSQAEIANTINQGVLDYIDDHSKDINKNEKYEDTQLFLPEELRVLFDKIFVEGKLNASHRPSLMEFKRACASSLQKMVECDYDGCKREFPDNEYMICPFCNHKVENTVIARLTKRITSLDKILLPHDGIKEFTSLPPVEEQVENIIISPGVKRIPRSFFTTNSDDTEPAMLIQYSVEKGKIAVRNMFSEIELKIGEKKLIPYSKAKNKTQSDKVLPIGNPLVVELPANTTLDSETELIISAKEYGTIKYEWLLTIE